MANESLKPGHYKITYSGPFLKEPSNTGVSLHPLPYQPVRLSGHVHAWKIAPQGPHVYRLSLKDSYPYIGVENGEVIATIDAKDDVEWRIIYHGEHSAWAIESNTGDRKGWTISAEKPDAQILLEPISTHPTRQLFHIEHDG